MSILRQDIGGLLLDSGTGNGVGIKPKTMCVELGEHLYDISDSIPARSKQCVGGKPFSNRKSTTLPPHGHYSAEVRSTGFGIVLLSIIRPGREGCQRRPPGRRGAKKCG